MRPRHTAMRLCYLGSMPAGFTVSLPCGIVDHSAVVAVRLVER